MSEHYDDAIAALAADYIPLGFTRRDPYRNVHEAARAVLDEVAPLIAAKAVRQAARDLSIRLDAERISRADLFTAMSSIADEIERGRS